MKIVQLIDSLDIGGGERMAVNLANYFNEIQVPNLLISTRKGGALEVLVNNKSSLEIYSKTNTLDFSTFFKILKKIKDFNPTIIHAHDSSIFWAALIKLFIPRLQLIWHAHYGGFSSQNDRFGSKVKFIQNLIDFVIVVNLNLLSWVNSNLSKVSKAVYIGNFPEKISKCQFERQELKLIISVANLKKPKDHKTLVLAFSKFLKLRSGYKLALIGSLDDANYLEELNSIIESESIQDHVLLLGPIVDMKEWFDKARMGILSSTIEGLPVSLLELGLSGIPVISSRVGACPSLLEEGKGGYLFHPEDVEELTENMIYLVDHPDDSKTKAQVFEQKVKTEFGGDNFYREYTELIKLS